MDTINEHHLTINDANNNENSEKEEGGNDGGDCKHSKFCFSQDLSTKEETLRKNALHKNAPPNIPRKKFVTFDRCGPRLIDTQTRASDSDSDESLEGLIDQAFTNLSDSDIVSTSASASEEVVNPKCQGIISKAEGKLVGVLNQLQSLWLNLQDDDQDEEVQKSALTNIGNKNLLQTISLIAMITDQISTQYRNCVNTKCKPEGVANTNWQNANELLEQELKNSRIKIQRLETEIKLLTRENAILNNEAKEIAYMAGCQRSADKKAAEAGENNKNTEAEILNIYKNPRKHFDFSDSKSSALPDGIRNSSNILSGRFEGHQDSPEIESRNEMMVLKRENEMDSLIRDFNERFQTNNCSLNAQFMIYDEHLENWKKMLHATTNEKQQMLQDLLKIVHEHKAVLKERDHYEFILKLLIQEKANDDFDVQALLHNIIAKLNEPMRETGSWVETSLLEGAVQTLQQQNSKQREELYRLNHMLSESQMYNQAQENELEACNKKIANFLDKLNANEAQLKILQEDAQNKCDTIQQSCDEAVASKIDLEKKLEEKAEKLKKAQEILKVFHKGNKKQQKKFHELQNNNSILLKEIKDSKGNMDHLAEIISQLRIGLKDQKSQWNERLRISAEEVAQNKQHCEWLKSQMEQLTQQLKDANERLKLHEMDKVQLAQQLLLAEEERRVVDRKLQELRTALQGDTGLREALIERNEALQLEINRLRHAKARNPQTVGTEDSPPTEMRKTNDLLSTVFLPPTANFHVADKFFTNKNCYTSPYRRPVDNPRAAVSLHNGGVK